MKSGRFKQARIAILLAVLAIVATDAWLTKKKVVRWTDPLVIGIFPIAVEEEPEVGAYVKGVSADAFKSLAPFFQREASRYQVYGDPVIEVVLGPALAEAPPPAPDGGVLSVIFWSLRLRYWAWSRLRAVDAPKCDVRMFVLYHRAADGKVLDHSFGLPEGLIGVAHAFAAPRAEPQNAVVIAHELLHTAGATDKYDEQGFPRSPEGYAEPTRQPLYPQVKAELMAGSVPTSASEARLPMSLDECVVGPATAKEVKWIWKEE